MLPESRPGSPHPTRMVDSINRARVGHSPEAMTGRARSMERMAHAFRRPTEDGTVKARAPDRQGRRRRLRTGLFSVPEGMASPASVAQPRAGTLLGDGA